MTVRVFCPAKVNTFLAVGPPDSRGYHPLRTVFQAVGLFDELHISRAGEDSIVCDWDSLPPDNTLTRTLRLIREAVVVPPLHIQLSKHIPSQSGLGGGSSDAAGLIRGLRPFLPAPLSEGFLQDVAISVGADVPFFLVGGRARGEGYGEQLTPMPDEPRRWLVLAKPDYGCSTPEMFRALDSIEREWREFPAEDELYNDFERACPCGCLELIDRLISLGADDAGLSGSGSAVFGRFPSEEVAAEAARGMEGEVWVVPTLSRQESPLVETLK